MTEDTIITKVQKLLDKAWSTTFPEEKQALLNKAEEMMQRYSIEQFQLLDPSRANTAEVKYSKPEARTIKAYPSNQEYLVYSAVFTMFCELARHLGCRVGPHKPDAEWGSHIIVGYPADLDFLEMMNQSLQLHFLSKVDPGVVPDLSWEANLIALKQAGIKWENIHRMLWKSHPNYPYQQPWERNIGVRFTGIYKKYRDLNPDEPANLGSPKQWREDFIIGYCHGIRQRLHEMRANLLENDKNLPALLGDKKSQVDEMFLEMFPPPPPVESKASNKPVRGSFRYRNVSHAARAAGGNAAKTADLTGRSGRVHTARKEL